MPLGTVDPLFLAELALEMKMPVGELGQRMSNYELCVFWPNYFAQRARAAEAEAEKQKQR